MQEVKSSVIMQKGESQNGCYKKTKHIKFSENEHFLPPDTHTCNLLKWNLGVKWVRLVCIKTFCFRIKLLTNIVSGKSGKNKCNTKFSNKPKNDQIWQGKLLFSAGLFVQIFNE